MTRKFGTKISDLNMLVSTESWETLGLWKREYRQYMLTLKLNWCVAKKKQIYATK